MTQMIELVDKDIKRIPITVFPMFKKLEERWKMLGSDMNNIKKDLNWTSSDENYDVWVKKCIGWN